MTRSLEQRPDREEPDIPGAVNKPLPLRGAIRLLCSLGHAVLAEVPLKNGRRADLLSLDLTGAFSIVEVKSGLPDFRSDRKWGDYLAWCDKFYFAVGPDFPLDLLPPEAGLIVSDHHDGILYKECRPCPLLPARRRALTLRFARLAAGRLMGRQDDFLAAL